MQVHRPAPPQSITSSPIPSKTLHDLAAKADQAKDAVLATLNAISFGPPGNPNTNRFFDWQSILQTYESALSTLVTLQSHISSSSPLEKSFIHPQQAFPNGYDHLLLESLLVRGADELWPFVKEQDEVVHEFEKENKFSEIGGGEVGDLQQQQQQDTGFMTPAKLEQLRNRLQVQLTGIRQRLEAAMEVVGEVGGEGEWTRRIVREDLVGDDDDDDDDDDEEEEDDEEDDEMQGVEIPSLNSLPPTTTATATATATSPATSQPTRSQSNEVIEIDGSASENGDDDDDDDDMELVR